MNGASPDQHGFERNLRLYPWYAVGFNAFAWMPIFFLYFSERMSLERVLQLEAIYYAVVVLLEVPSGYFSDVVGRKATLLISSAALIGAYVLFVIDSSFAVFVAAQVLLAMGIAFNSGTDTSFHYDSLASLNREEEFDSREAIVARNGLLSSALAALVGGFAGAIGLHFAYVASAVAAIGTFVIVLAFVEPRSHERATFLGTGVVRQLSLCLGYLRRGEHEALLRGGSGRTGAERAHDGHVSRVRENRQPLERVPAPVAEVRRKRARDDASWREVLRGARADGGRAPALGLPAPGSRSLVPLAAALARRRG